MHLDLYLSIGILLLISAFFAIGGGATAVIWTGKMHLKIHLKIHFYCKFI
jgi:hypothetical protein